jgi:hypothetical protein
MKNTPRQSGRMAEPNPQVRIFLFSLGGFLALQPLSQLKNDSTNICLGFRYHQCYSSAICGPISSVKNTLKPTNSNVIALHLI